MHMVINDMDLQQPKRTVSMYETNPQTRMNWLIKWFMTLTANQNNQIKSLVDKLCSMVYNPEPIAASMVPV